MITRRALLAGTVGSVVTTSGAAEANAIAALPLGLFVATGETPVVSDEWLSVRASETNRLLSAHELSVSLAWRKPLPLAKAELETAKDRDALAEWLVPGAINVFVVPFFRDIDDPKRMRMGVRWRQRSKLYNSYVIVSASAATTTLCHELGHELGLAHSTVVDNVMSYKRENPERLAFDAHQGRVMRQVARTMWARKKLLGPH